MEKEILEQNDKLLQVSACEIISNGRQVKGKLFIFKKRITFCSIFVYSGFMQQKPDPKKHMLEIKLSQIESLEIMDQSIHVKTINKTSMIFLNFQSLTQEIFQIIRTNHEVCFNSQSEQISPSIVFGKQGTDINFSNTEIKTFSNQLIGWPSLKKDKSKLDWSQYKRSTQPVMESMLELKKDHSYGKPQTILLNDVSIVDVFDIIYTDKSYQPSSFMKLGNKSKVNFQNPLHYVLEGLVGDRNFRSTLWQPSIPSYLKTGDKDSDIPLELAHIDQLPSRTIVMDHPTKLPFFGEVYPQVTMNQKLLLVDDKEFWIFVTSEITGMVYSENFKMKGYYKVIEVKQREFYIETKECVEWKKKLLFVSGQIDQASAKENERIFNAYVQPFLKERNNEVIQLRQEERKEDLRKEEEQLIKQKETINLRTYSSNNDDTQSQIQQNGREMIELKDHIISLEQTINKHGLSLKKSTNSLKYLMSAQVCLLILILLVSFI